jgi:UDP-galactopyranose mutase
MQLDVLVVGAGFSGAVVAERLAASGLRVLVIDKRPHIGGNAYDTRDAHGLLIHPYGPHIFHTNSMRIAEYLSRFTEWRKYEHRVLAQVCGGLVPIPINVDTVNRLYGLQLDETTIQQYFDRVREPREPVRTSEDVVLNAVGRDLYEKFFRGYTRKQWGLDPSQLSASVAARIPTRTNRDDRYFTDAFQNMPLHGYTALFDNMLDDPNIQVEVGVDYLEAGPRLNARHTVYTGPIDGYFGYCFGRLPYRSLRFEHEHVADMTQYQPVGTVNYPNDYDYTRITEFKHLTGEDAAGTSIVREYPQAEGDPYYPVPRPENEMLFKRYEELARKETGVTFVGRLAQYRYYNMDQCVGAALKAAQYVIEGLGETPADTGEKIKPHVLPALPAQAANPLHTSELTGTGGCGTNAARWRRQGVWNCGAASSAPSTGSVTGTFARSSAAGMTRASTTWTVWQRLESARCATRCSGSTWRRTG